MKYSSIIIVTLMTTGICPTYAGSIVNGKWSAEGCGKHPEVPVINDSDIESYNQSVAAINDWQQKSRTYFECVVQEASSDNKLIVESTIQGQAKYRETLEKITVATEAAAKNFEQK